MTGVGTEQTQRHEQRRANWRKTMSGKQNDNTGAAGNSYADSTGSNHMVTADHPTLKRPDKKFTGINSFCNAMKYADELSGVGYENILVSECDQNKEITLHRDVGF
jgi:hypothetical protein